MPRRKYDQGEFEGPAKGFSSPLVAQTVKNLPAVQETRV